MIVYNGLRTWEHLQGVYLTIGEVGVQVSVSLSPFHFCFTLSCSTKRNEGGDSCGDHGFTVLALTSSNSSGDKKDAGRGEEEKKASILRTCFAKAQICKRELGEAAIWHKMDIPAGGR